MEIPSLINTLHFPPFHIVSDYVFEDNLGKCYKFHLGPKTWPEAYAICNAELSYLAVINSQDEADHLTEMTELAPKDHVQGNFLRGAVHLGFHKRGGEWKTIKGELTIYSFEIIKGQ